MNQNQPDKEEEVEEGYSYVINPPQKVGLAGHNWRQQGPMLICQSCPYEHSQFIPPNLIYKGLDKEGLPILEELKR